MRALRIVFLVVVTSFPLLAQGPLWTHVGGGLSSTGLGAVAATGVAAAVFDDGGGPELWVGGRFTHAGGNPANGLASWDGHSWTARGLGLSLDPSFGGELFVKALRVFDDGSGPALYVGGFFSGAGGIAVDGLARWQSGAWSAVGVPGPMIRAVSEFEVVNEGSGAALYVVRGVFSDALERWDGAALSPIGLAPSVLRIHDLHVFNDGSGAALHAVGFTSAPGSEVHRWDGVTWTQLGASFSYPYTVECLGDFDSGSGPELLIGGALPFPSSEAVGRWNGNGWVPLGVTFGTCSATKSPVPAHRLEALDDGSGPALYISFGYGQGCSLNPYVGPVSVNGCARWDGATRTIERLGPTADFELYDEGSGPTLFAVGAGRALSALISGVARRERQRLGVTMWQVFPSRYSPGIDALYTNLTPGHEYHALVNPDVCPGVIGSGPASLLGFCTLNPGAIVDQLSLPLGTPYHFVANDVELTMEVAPFSMPLTFEVVLVDATVFEASSVTRIQLY